MLDKDPARRYPHAALLAKDLAALPTVRSGNPSPLALSPADVGIWSAEQRLVSLVVAAEQDDRDSTALSLDEDDPRVQQRRELLDALCRDFAFDGAQSAVLADGSLVATLPAGGGTATDQAIQAARGATMVLQKWPSGRVAVATGRALLGDRLPTGEALARAGKMLQEAAALQPETSAVLVDAVTAGLLDRHFRVQPLTPSSAVLAGEQDTYEGSPLLLGRATAFVGREQELAILETTFAACLDEETPRVVLVSGVAGVGKSRLRQEFLARLRVSGIPTTLLVGRSEPMTVRSPYALIRQLLRRLCDLHEGESPQVQLTKLHQRLAQNIPAEQLQRVGDFLAELCEVPRTDAASLPVRAARQNPRVMDDQLTRAFIDWLQAECAARPVLVVLDDIHFADQASILLMGLAIRELRDRQFMLVALARQETDRAAPRLWSEHAFPLPLLPLTKRACERLVTQVLGSKVDAPQAARIVERAAGNPLFLEELIRAAADGKSNTLPETVLTMIQARLERLDATSRRLLRAASILGEQFWPAAVKEVLGGAPGLEASLGELLSHELIVQRRGSRFPTQAEYAFRHVLLRDAAYEMLSPKERRAGHRTAGRWLEQQGEQDVRVLADHAQRGEEPARAVEFYVRAAEQSFSRNDLDGVFSLVEQGLGCGAREAARGTLLGVQALARFFSSDMAGCLRDGTEALHALRPGQARWYQVVGALVNAAGLLGQHDTLRTLLALLRQVPPQPEAAAAKAEALASVVIMYGLSGAREQALQVLDSASALIDPDSDSDVLAHGALQLAHSMFINMLEPDPFRALQLAEAGISACRTVGDRRQEGLCRIACGEALFALGEPSRGAHEMRSALQLGQQLHELLVELLAAISLALNMVLSGDPSVGAEAERIVIPVIADPRITPVYRGHAFTALAGALLAQGRSQEAEAKAREALTLIAAAPVYRPRVLALLMMSLRAQSRAAEAVPLAQEGLRLLGTFGGAGRTELMFRHAVVLTWIDMGNLAVAREALGVALQQLQVRAARIPGTEMRQTFLSGVPTNVRLRELAQQYLPKPEKR
jgi:tetratricopeptide (TPR) repeat protein